MKPVMQTKFGDKEGNCWAACLASIFECKIEDIPEMNENNWIRKTNDFLANRELYYVEIESKDNEYLTTWLIGYHCLIGKSPRGNFQHAVVGFCGEVVHDPHPDNTGLDNIKSYGIFAKIL